MFQNPEFGVIEIVELNVLDAKRNTMFYANFVTAVSVDENVVPNNKWRQTAMFQNAFFQSGILLGGEWRQQSFQFFIDNEVFHGFQLR